MSIEQDVKNWLADEGVFREKAADENADFHFVIEFPKDNIMDVVKPKEKDVIVIGCATQVAPEHINLMQNASPQDKNKFLFDKCKHSAGYLQKGNHGKKFASKRQGKKRIAGS